MSTVANLGLENVQVFEAVPLVEPNFVEEAVTLQFDGGFEQQPEEVASFKAEEPAPQTSEAPVEEIPVQAVYDLPVQATNDFSPTIQPLIYSFEQPAIAIQTQIYAEPPQAEVCVPERVAQPNGPNCYQTEVSKKYLIKNKKDQKVFYNRSGMPNEL